MLKIKTIIITFLITTNITKSENSSKNEDIGTVKMGLTYFDHPVKLIKSCEFQKKKIILIFTLGGELHISENSGFDFKKQKFSKKNNFEIKKIFRFANKSPFFVLTTNSYIITTKNCFLDFEKKKINFEIEKIKFDKINQNNFLIYEMEKKNEQKKTVLYKTENFGNTISLLLENILDFMYFQKKHKNGILALIYNPKLSINKEIFWNTETELIYSENFFSDKEKKIISKGINKLIESKNYIFCSKIKNPKKKYIKLYKIFLLKKKIEILPINLPFRNLEDFSYTILNGKNEEIFIHVNHNKKKNYGHLYFSENGVDFFLIQKHVIRDDMGFADFEEIKGNPRIFISNVLSPLSYERGKMEDDGNFENEDFIDFGNEEKVKNKDNSENEENTKNEKTNKNPKKTENPKNFEITTKISYNSGITWLPLKTQNSEFHFHSQSSAQNTSMYSHPKTPGLLLTNGNKGPYLTRSANGYKSLNFGKTFEKLSKGSNIYGSTSSGDFVIFISEEKPTKKMSFSINQGHTFRPLPLTEDEIVALEIKNFEIFPDLLLLSAFQIVRDSRFGVVIAVFFGDLLKKKCGFEDFEKLEAFCVNGHAFEGVRKNKEAVCRGFGRFGVFRREQCFCRDEDFFRVKGEAFLPKSNFCEGEEGINGFDGFWVLAVCLVFFGVFSVVRKRWKCRLDFKTEYLDVSRVKFE